MVIKDLQKVAIKARYPRFIIISRDHRKSKKMQDQVQQIQNKEINEKIFLSKLRNLQSNIYEDIQKMASLKEIYHDTQEKKFLLTFINIMDRMSNELQRANDLYQEIDKEIASNQQCMYLSKELQYFQNQCVELKQNLKHKQSLLEAERAKEEKMRKEMHHLESKLFLETYREMKYKSKLEEKDKGNKYPLGKTKSNGSSDLRSRSMQIRNKSTEITDVRYDDIYKKRSRSLRHAISFRTEMKMKPAFFIQNQKSVNLFTTSRQK